ncbi:hypothetical protein ASG67_11770 [Sphingomonas sp. Leaf339]|nr:hypothetical protein ASG67_11770 [Sphingomonas sp. Leaf339]
MKPTNPWPAITDDARVERLIAAIQKEVVGESGGKEPYSDETELHGPDLANALLFVLATVLEPSPSCNTPAGVRKMAGATGKELHQLMKETRQMKAVPIGTV